MIIDNHEKMETLIPIFRPFRYAYPFDEAKVLRYMAIHWPKANNKPWTREEQKRNVSQLKTLAGQLYKVTTSFYVAHCKDATKAHSLVPLNHFLDTHPNGDLDKRLTDDFCEPKARAFSANTFSTIQGFMLAHACRLDQTYFVGFIWNDAHGKAEENVAVVSGAHLLNYHLTGEVTRL